MAKRRARRKIQYDTLEQQWKLNRELDLPDALAAELREVNRDWSREQFHELDGWKNPKKITGEDVARILSIALDITADSDFSVALGALHRHGLNRGSLRIALRHGINNPLLDACARVVHVRRGKAGGSVRETAEVVAAEFGIDGESFDSVAEELRKAYRRLFA
jgi:hypothetical protein